MQLVLFNVVLIIYFVVANSVSDKKQAAPEVRSNRAIVVANSVSDRRVVLLTQFAATSLPISSGAHIVRSNGPAVWEGCSRCSQLQNAAHEVRSNGANVVANSVSDKNVGLLTQFAATSSQQQICSNGFINNKILRYIKC